MKWFLTLLLVIAKVALSENIAVRNNATFAYFRQVLVNNQDDVYANFVPNEESLDGSYLLSTPIVINANEHEIVISSSSQRVTFIGSGASQIFSISTCENVSISGFAILNGFVAGFGGAVKVQSSKCTFNDIIFQSNRSLANAEGNSKGGALFCSGSTIWITECDFIENECGFDCVAPSAPNYICHAFGGAVSLEYCDLHMFSSLESGFNLNNAKNGTGGGIYIFESTFEINNVNFSNNTSCFDGGAAKIAADDFEWVDGSDNFGFSDCSFSDNISRFCDQDDTQFFSFGGAIACGDWNPNLLHMKKINIVDCTFQGNEADRGGAISCNNTFISQENSGIFNENASVKGGAIYSNGGVNIKYANFDTNSAELNGGAVYCNNNNCYTRFEKCNFENNTAQEGGAIMAVENVLTADSCRFYLNKATTRGGAISFPYTKSGTVIQTEILDCVFEDCFVESDNSQQPTEIGEGGAIFSSGQLTVSNTQFLHCYVSNCNHALGGALYLSMIGSINNYYYFEYCLFKECYIDPLTPSDGSTISHGDVMTNYFDGGVIEGTEVKFIINNSTVINCGLTGGYSESSICLDHETDEIRVYNSVFFNTTHTLVTALEDVFAAENSIWYPGQIDPEYLFFTYNPDLMLDGKIKNGSPCLDAGSTYYDRNDNPVYTDQDLTLPDIGYMPRFDAKVKSGTNYDLPIGLYVIDNGATTTVRYNNELPPGTMFIVGDGSVLNIICDANGGVFILGAPNDVRTTISTHANARAQSFTFSGSGGEVLDFEGIYFYQVPDNLIFKNCDISLDQNASNEKLKIEGSNANNFFNIGFEDCVGEIRNYDFEQQNGNLPVDYISMLRSSVNVIDCNFGQPGAAGYALMVNGHVPLHNMIISGCNFEGGSTTYPSLKLQDTDPRLESNDFLGCKYYAIWSYLGVFGMDHGARNNIKSEYFPPFTAFDKFMYLFNSPVHLTCGENNFVYSGTQYAPNFRFIYYRGPEPPITLGSDLKDYNRNYWGRTCSTPVDPIGRIPSWANPGTPLVTCSTPSLPYQECPQHLPIEMLLNVTLQAEMLGNVEAAKNGYSQLLQDYSGTRESYVAALRLKGLGFLDESGTMIEELRSLADVAKTEDSHLAAYLIGAAECVRAWQGDVESASANLVTMRDEAATEDEAIVAQKDLLEIETYPVDGGLSSVGGEVLTRMLQARQSLQAFDPENPYRIQPRRASAAVRPASIQIEKVWPNPFNPITTLRFHLWDQQRVAVRVYNLMGALVETLYDNELGAGMHDFTWQADNVASGLYILRVETQRQTEQMKVLFIK
jgi:hypothetical protein